MSAEGGRERASRDLQRLLLADAPAVGGEVPLAGRRQARVGLPRPGQGGDGLRQALHIALCLLDLRRVRPARLPMSIGKSERVSGVCLLLFLVSVLGSALASGNFCAWGLFLLMLSS